MAQTHELPIEEVVEQVMGGGWRPTVVVKVAEPTHAYQPKVGDFETEYVHDPAHGPFEHEGTCTDFQNVKHLYQSCDIKEHLRYLNLTVA